jgi:hypothetical protein
MTEHDVVRLNKDYPEVKEGAEGTVVSTYAGGKVAVDFGPDDVALISTCDLTLLWSVGKLEKDSRPGTEKVKKGRKSKQ